MTQSWYKPGADWPLGHLRNARWAGLKIAMNIRTNGLTPSPSSPHSLKDARAGFETQSEASSRLYV